MMELLANVELQFAASDQKERRSGKAVSFQETGFDGRQILTPL
jgi:hypothetical protein